MPRLLRWSLAGLPLIAILALLLGSYAYYGPWMAAGVLLATILTALMFLLACRILGEMNILFTFVREGTVKAIMKGEELSHFVLSFKGWHLNDPRRGEIYDSRYDAWHVLEGDYDDRPWFMRWIGLYWVGLPPFFSVYRYYFEWNETRHNKAKGFEELWVRQEWTDFVYVSDFTYAMILPAAETGGKGSAEGGNLSVDVLYHVTVAVRNPDKVLFKVEDWLKRTEAATNRVARNYIGSRTFEELKSETDESKDSKKDNFSYQIIELNERLPDDVHLEEERQVPSLPRGLLGHYGVIVKAADVQSVELAEGAGPELRAAITRQYVAHQTSAATRIEAEGKADATRLQGDADAYVIERKGKAEATSMQERLTVMEAHGEAARLLAQLDAVRNPAEGDKIIWANNFLKP